MKPGLRRRTLVQAAAALPLAGCEPEGPSRWEARWVGASVERGHRLRATSEAGAWPSAAVQRRAGVLVLGGGVAGLAALRALVQAGDPDAQALELEDRPGGNSRGHLLGSLPCPLGAHYLPLPGPQAHEVSDWLHEIGLLRQELGRTVANERHLCHSPQERLFIDGHWQEGLLPSAEGRPATLAQYRRFSEGVARAQRELGFSLPTHRAPWTAGHTALDAIRFTAWLQREQLDDERLLAYLDYVCRDDYGAGIDQVSAWAGLHYFAGRHGFNVPGDEASERDAVFTWPEGNAWLVQRLAAPLEDRLHTGRTVLKVAEGRHGVEVLAWNEATAQAERWQAGRVVLALPLFIAARVLESPPAALHALAPRMRMAPWLVANLQLDAPLLDRPGAPPSWDNVAYAPAGRTTSLGYVDARHQSLRPDAAATLLTAYHALPVSARSGLLQGSAREWAAYAVSALQALHPDLPARLRHADLMRYGHAMSIPVPGLRGHPALRALRAPQGRLGFAHADLAGYSVFEEAFTAGDLAGRAAAVK